MKIFKFINYIALLLILIIGCSRDKTTKIDGMSLEMWAARLDDQDTDSKLDALEAISYFGIEAVNLEQRLIYVGRYDKNNEVRYQAVKLLETLNLPTYEFHDFLDLYNAPLIPDFSEDEPLFGTGPTGKPDKSSVMDDLDFLKELVEGASVQSRTRVVVVPTESAEYEEWVKSKRTSGIFDLKQMLNNPDVLLGLFKSGDELEKTFAFDRLSKVEDLDPKILEELLKMAGFDENESLNSADISKLLKLQR